MSTLVAGGADGVTTVFLAGRLGNVYVVPAAVILLLFYGIYFTKQMVQKHHGIQTRQLGRGSKKAARTTEIILSAATFLIVPVQLLSIVLDWNTAPSFLRITGAVAGLCGDLVFLAAVRTMKDSWRAGIPEQGQTEFVSHGIYSCSRNPAFLGFDLMYAGILFLFFNWLLLLFTIWAVLMLHMQILQEEAYLEYVFQEEYREYQKHVCRYLGRRRE